MFSAERYTARAIIVKTMAADTNLSVNQIEVGLAHYFNYRNNIIVPNVSWGLLPYEADLLVLNKSGYVTEVEIKRSWADFLADFRKEHKHNTHIVSWRYYAVPAVIVEKCEAKLKELDPYKTWGLLSYYEYGGVVGVSTVYYPCNLNRHKAENKLSIEEQFQLARLGAMRVWSIKTKLYENGR